MTCFSFTNLWGIFWKIAILYYLFLDDNNLLSSNQSGFTSSDSCEYQLLSIVYDIYVAFNCCPSLRGIFLDITKTFDWVWHENLIYKLQSLGISSLPLKCIESFLSNRFQRVLLNTQSSSWSPVLGGMLQRSILGPLLFLVYINDLSKYLSSTAKVFADYTSIFSVVHDISLSLLAYQWKMTFSSNVHDISLSLLAYQRKMSFNPKVTKQV